MGLLENRVAIITGAAGGIGSACARGYAHEGAAVVLADLDEPAVTELAESINNSGGRALGIKCDVEVDEDIDAVVDAAIKAFDTVDILFNLAQGGLRGHRFLEDVTAEDATLAFRSGPLQSMKFMQKCLPHMRAQGYGRIINCGAQASLAGVPGLAAYEMAKGALAALTRNASQEWGQYGITTNTMMPALKTAAWNTMPTISSDDLARSIGEGNPMRRFGIPQDAVSLLVFLASEGAGFINGQSIAVDGGANLFA